MMLDHRVLTMKPNTTVANIMMGLLHTQSYRRMVHAPNQCRQHATLGLLLRLHISKDPLIVVIMAGIVESTTTKVMVGPISTSMVM
jgi:hypothetical protein